MRIHIDQTTNEYDEEFLYRGKPFTGEVIDTGANGEIVDILTLTEGRPDGPALAWHANGRLKYQGENKNGVAVGKHTSWYEDGKIKSENIFHSNGSTISAREWDRRGTPIEERVEIGNLRFNAGKKIYTYGELPFTGEGIETLSDGRLSSLKTFRLGNLDGPHRSWYPNGQLRSEGQHYKGLPTGVQLEWHENGQPAQEITYNENNQVVSRRRWNENGEIEQINNVEE